VPITLPSHATMFTGKYPTETGMHDFSGNRLNPAENTLASVLRAQGYETGAVVGSAVLDSRFGVNLGFNTYYDNFDFSRLDEKNLDAMERPGSEVVDQSLAWLQQNSSKRFFLFVHLYDPHHPYRPPAPYDSRFRARPYDGEVAYVDAQIGRLLQFLREKNLYERTLIVLVGDHGEAFGEHGEKTHGFFVYNSTLHVPLILRMPGGGARVVADSVSLVSVFPTLLEMLGVPAPAGLKAKSLAPLMQGKKEKQPEGLYAETYLPRIHFNWSELRSIRYGQYHFIDAPKPELYDLSKDPRETRNLYAEKPEVAQDLRKQLARLIKKYSPSKGGTTAQESPLDPALAERLKSLGYVAVSTSSDIILSDRQLPDPKDRIQMYETVSEALADSQNGRFADSVVKLKSTLKIEPDSLPVRYLLALNYYRMKDYRAAVEEFQQVLRLSPNYSLAVFYSGMAHARSGDFEQAIIHLRRALELDPTNALAAFNLGAAYLQKGNVPEAAAAFRQSVSLDPESAAGHEALGEVLLYQGRVDEAIEALRKAVALAPNNGKVRRSLAKALEAKGLTQEAQEELRKAGPPSRPQR
jgi:arylsulfatase A-like enzyme/Flp pilus assembly protein TadD